MDFQKARMQQGFGKVGILGFAGSGKSYTAHEIARGLHIMIGSKKPVTCIETENGVDYLIPLYDKDKIEIEVAKTRAFADLNGLIKKSETISDILVIDSVTHFWQDIVESYRKKKNVNRLAFQDWGIIKPMWNEFTDNYLNSKIHIVMCGRAGFEYDYFENDDGKMELYKTGTKMKVESEMGYEPSLLIEMERIRENGSPRKTKKSGKGQADSKVKIGGHIVHRAHVLKDRNQYKSLDGMEFDNPTFDSFLPHFKALNLGGEHLGVETERDSTSLFNIEGKPNWRVEQEQKEITRGEIKGVIEKYFPSSSAKEKQAKILLKEHVFNVRSDEAIDHLDLSTLKIGLEYLDWMLKDQNVIELFMKGTQTEIVEILKAKQEEWQIFNADPAQ